MKIAVGGKGGSGKTTIAGTLARVLAARGLRYRRSSGSSSSRRHAAHVPRSGAGKRDGGPSRRLRSMRNPVASL